MSDPSHRETYESAHSVVLAIFASHAQTTSSYTDDKQATFIQQIIPSYLKCLLDVRL